MRIELIRYKFNGTNAYKYRPIRYCCKKMRTQEYMLFTNEDIIESEQTDDYEYEGNYCPVPRFCLTKELSETSWEDTFDWTENCPIQYCPFCGEKIEISVVGEKDVDEEYKILQQERIRYVKESYRTDSRNKSMELSRKIRQIDNQINAFYYLDEIKEAN